MATKDKKLTQPQNCFEIISVFSITSNHRQWSHLK